MGDSSHLYEFQMSADFWNVTSAHWICLIKYREVHQSVPGMFEEFQSQNLSIGGLNQAIYVLFTVRISIKFLMPRDISEMSPRQPNMPGLREQMLTWTETKTSLTCYCEHKLHHTQTKFRWTCLLYPEFTVLGSFLFFHFIPWLHSSSSPSFPLDTVIRLLFLVASHLASSTARSGGPLPKDQLAELLSVSHDSWDRNYLLYYIYKLWLQECAFLILALLLLFDTGLRLSRRRISNS